MAHLAEELALLLEALDDATRGRVAGGEEDRVQHLGGAGELAALGPVDGPVGADAEGVRLALDKLHVAVAKATRDLELPGHGPRLAVLVRGAESVVDIRLAVRVRVVDFRLNKAKNNNNYYNTKLITSLEIIQKHKQKVNGSKQRASSLCIFFISSELSLKYWVKYSFHGSLTSGWTLLFAGGWWKSIRSGERGSAPFEQEGF